MSQYPDIGASEDFTVETLRQMIPNYVIKSNSESRASTTTATDDSDLTFSVEANATYHVKFNVFAAAVTASDIKTSWTVPTGAGGLRKVSGPGSTAADGSADNVAGKFGVHGFTTEITYSGVRNSNTLQFWIYEEALLIVSGTAGNCAIKWAQATSGGTATIVYASWVEYRRIA